MPRELIIGALIFQTIIEGGGTLIRVCAYYGKYGINLKKSGMCLFTYIDFYYFISNIW